MGARAIVVVQGEIHRLDAFHVVGVAANGVRLADGIRRMGSQFLFKRGQKRRKDVDHEAIRSSQDLTDVLIYDGVEDDRAYTITLGRGVDLLDHGPRLFRRIDVGTGEFIERNALELSEQTLAQGFGSDAGAVGDEERGSFHLRSGP
ncbi:hypothetical protein D3C78_1296400 [compost metagenome]